MSAAPKVLPPPGCVEGGWSDHFAKGRRGQPRSLPSVEAPAIVQPIFAAWKQAVGGSIVWGVVETMAGKFVRCVRSSDTRIDRSTFPLTEERAREIAAQMNSSEIPNSSVAK